MTREIVLESCCAIALATALAFLWRHGRKHGAVRGKGWSLFLCGLLLLLFGALLDLSSKVPALSSWGLLGTPRTRDVVENVVGHLGGLLCLGWGLALWIPRATKVKEASLLADELAVTNARLRELNEMLEVRSRRQEQFVSLVDNASELITMTTIEGETIYMNRAGQRMIGLSSEHELCRVHLSDYLVDEGRSHLSTVLPRTAAKDHEWVGETRLCQLESGDSIDVILSIFTMLHPRTKEPMCFGIVASDISRRKKAEHELLDAKRAAEERTRAKSDLLANMSHELRTPLTSILGFAETLREPDLPSVEHDTAVRTISENGRYLLGVINDVLDLSRIEAGELGVERITFSPFDVVDEVERSMQPLARREDNELRLLYTTSSPARVTGDPTRLRQILVHLVSNSLQLIDRGTVFLTVTFLEGTPDHPPHLDFCVVGSRKGLPDSQIRSLVGVLTRVRPSTRREPGLAGLGVTISESLTTLLGGEMHVSGRRDGSSLFRVSLPTGPLDGVAVVDAPPRTPTAHPQVEPIHPDDLSGVTVLLAEDNEVNRGLISRILTKAGAQVSVAENGEIAVERARGALEADAPFDVVLMDMRMPVLDGYEATRLLREGGYERPIIALTANAMESDRELCLAAGCDEYATKPIDRGSLFRTIRGKIGRHPGRSRKSVPGPEPESGGDDRPEVGTGG